MDSGYDLIWSDTTIMASVDGSPTVSVVQCAEGEYENCWSSTDSETDYWNVGEAILIDTLLVVAYAQLPFQLNR